MSADAQKGVELSALAGTFQALAQEMGKIGAVYAKTMSDFMASPSGQYLKAVCDHYERHPEELNAMIAAREAEAGAERSCHCLCQRWNHLGECDGRATTTRGFGATAVPLCASCAASVDAHPDRVVSRR